MKIGYARVSTPDQNPALQLEALEKAGCEKIYQEKKSAFKERPELIRALEDLRTGDILYVWSLDRLGRSMKEIRTNVDLIMYKGAHLVDVKHNIDTSTPSGKLLRSESSRHGSLYRHRYYLLYLYIPDYPRKDSHQKSDALKDSSFEI